MGLGQTMLTTMFLVLLTMAVVNANRLIIDRDILFYEQEAYKQAGILANALLQEIVRKKFDSKVDTSRAAYLASSRLNNPDSLDQPGSMGAGAGAIAYVNPSGADDVAPYKSIGDSPSTTRFDDIDDYNGYHRSASAGNLTGFVLTVEVYYVKLVGGVYTKVTTLGTATYWKKIDIKVTNSKYLKTDLVFSTIAAY